jgi:hypothetical protein
MEIVVFFDHTGKHQKSSYQILLVSLFFHTLGVLQVYFVSLPGI